MGGGAAEEEDDSEVEEELDEDDAARHESNIDGRLRTRAQMDHQIKTLEGQIEATKRMQETTAATIAYLTQQLQSVPPPNQ